MRRLLLLFAVSCNAMTGIDDYKIPSGPADAAGGEGGDGGAASEAGGDSGAMTCPGGMLYCPASQSCVASCAGCATGPIECFSCPPAAGRCYAEADPQSCLRASGWASCPCDMNKIAMCHGATETCVRRGGQMYDCKTCGAPGTDGLACKDGQMCDMASRTCM